MFIVKVVGIVPVHNHAAWCVDALHSLVRQTYVLDSICVVDDGSTDRSVELILANADMHPVQGPGPVLVWEGDMGGVPMVLVSLPDATGPANARNVAMNLGRDRAEVFAFLDSDDLYHPEKVAKSVVVLDKYPEVGFVYSDYHTVGVSGHRQRQYKPPFSVPHLLRECIVNCDSVVRKSVMDFVGGFPPLRVCEDYAVWLRASSRFVGYHLAESLLDIRVGTHSSTSRVSPEVWRDCYREAFTRAGYSVGPAK